MKRASGHAAGRVRERTRTASDPDKKLGWLWKRSRLATQDDFSRFDTAPFPGREYRVTSDGRTSYLIVRSTDFEAKFITLIAER